MGKIFKDISVRDSAVHYKYLTVDEYLSGNIRNKLEAAENTMELLENLGTDATDTDKEMMKYNINELNKSVPTKLEASDIGVKFGSTWIPESYKYMGN